MILYFCVEGPVCSTKLGFWVFGLFFFFSEKLYSFGIACYFSSTLSFHSKDEFFFSGRYETLEICFLCLGFILVGCSCAESNADSDLEGEGPGLRFLGFF